VHCRFFDSLRGVSDTLKSLVLADISFLDWPVNCVLRRLAVLSLTNTAIALPGPEPTSLLDIVEKCCPSLEWLFLGGSKLVVRAQHQPRTAAAAGADHESSALGSVQQPRRRLRPRHLVIEVTFLQRAITASLEHALDPATFRLVRLDDAADAAWLLKAALPAGQYRRRVLEGAMGVDGGDLDHALLSAPVPSGHGVLP
jgi:hypothetical protein